MSDHCENSQSRPCPNKPYRVVELVGFGIAYTLCRKHYRGVMSERQP